MRSVTRRRVLKTGLAGAVLLAAWPGAVGAEVAAEFLPHLEQGAGSAPWGVAIGPDGLIYVTDSRLHQLAAQSPDGGIVRVLAESGSGPGQVRRPQGVVVSPEGEVYVVDGGNRRVQVFDPEGELLRQWGRRGSDPGEFSAPRGIALDAFGDVYVADGFNDRIQKFDRDGEFLLAWGSRGRAPGQFSTPTGIAIGASQTVYVADTFRDRVQAFELDGSFAAVVVEAPEVRNPIGLAVDTADRLYISTDVDHGLVVIEHDGTTAGTIGTEGDEDGEFQFPRGVDMDEIRPCVRGGLAEPPGPDVPHRTRAVHAGGRGGRPGDWRGSARAGDVGHRTQSDELAGAPGRSAAGRALCGLFHGHWRNRPLGLADLGAAARKLREPSPSTSSAG